MHNCHEIVRVLNDCKLIDCESFERRYGAGPDDALAAGFYIVTWPVDTRSRQYDECARFSGPYKTQSLAQLALEHRLAHAA